MIQNHLPIMNGITFLLHEWELEGVPVPLLHIERQMVAVGRVAFLQLQLMHQLRWYLC